MILFKNKNPSGKMWNALFGLAEIIDGVVRVVTFGVIATELPLRVSRYQAKAMLKNLKRKHHAHI